MGKLGDVLGEDFEEDYTETRERRKEEAKEVPKEVMMKIAHAAINGDKFEGEEPRFRFSGEHVDHDVLLMESPDNNMNKFIHDLGDTAKTLGMFHMGELFSCAFRKNMIPLLEKIETDEYYIVVGRYEEKTKEDSDGNKQTHYNVNPVRGIMPLEVAKNYAEEVKDEMEGSSIEEQSEKQTSESDTDVDLGDDGPSEASRQDIIKVFKAVGQKNKELLEGVVDNSDDSISNLQGIADDNVDGEVETERMLDIFEEEVEEIEGRGEEDDDDSLLDGDLDLGGDEDESSTDEEPSDDSDVVEEDTESSDEEDENSESEGVEDWFDG